MIHKYTKQFKIVKLWQGFKMLFITYQFSKSDVLIYNIVDWRADFNIICAQGQSTT